MNKLIEIKHWHLLVLILFPGIVINLLDLNDFWLWFGTIWYCIIYNSWLFSIGNVVCKTNANSLFEIFLFKISFIYPFICFAVVIYKQFSDPNSFPYWLVPFQILLISSEFYFMYFVSKNLVNFEKKHGVETSNIFSTFCAFWFFPIGIFFVQPRVNQLKQVYQNR